MQPFDLEKALAGEPVKLVDGSKAFIKYQLPDEMVDNQYPKCTLFGYILDENNKAIPYSWNKDGVGEDPRIDDTHIIGMWEEPRPQATITIPAPLLNDQKEKWYIDVFGDVLLGDEDNSDGYLNSGLLFATKEDAQAFLQAMREARR